RQSRAVRDHLVLLRRRAVGDLRPVHRPSQRECLMPEPVKAYAELEKRFVRLATLRGAVGMLLWAQAVVMPRRVAPARGEQISTLRVLAHGLLVAPEMAERLDEAQRGSEALDGWQRANLREMARRHAHATAVPGDLVEALSRAITRCETIWRDARPAS